MRRLSADDVLGFTWGPEQVAVATSLAPGVASCRTVVQLDGAMSTASYQTGMEYILNRSAEVLRATAIRLPAPLYADPSTVMSMDFLRISPGRCTMSTTETVYGVSWRCGTTDNSTRPHLKTPGEVATCYSRSGGTGRLGSRAEFAGRMRG